MGGRRRRPRLGHTGASGDPEFLAALRATEIVRKKYPDMGVEIGMAGEFVLGMHGQLEYDGVRLAGLYPREQMQLAQKAGATMFGPVVNTNTGKSCAWNIARALTLIKPCMAEATIPIHPNAGMGVGGVPMFVDPLVDAVCRAASAASSTSSRSTGCRWARVTPSACRAPTRRPRAWAECGQPEIW